MVEVKLGLQENYNLENASSVLDIFEQRKQIRGFSEVNPTRELIDLLLARSLELSPSKQNLQPYNIYVLGPEHKEHKKTLYDYSTHSGCMHNVSLYAPYVFVINDRWVEETEHMKSEHYKNNSGSFDEKKYRDKDTNLEIGMWATIFTGLCLEKDLAVAYHKCFKRDAILPFMTDPIEFIVSVGYKIPNKVYKKTRHIKPNPQRIIQWVDSHDSLST